MGLRPSIAAYVDWAWAKMQEKKEYPDLPSYMQPMPWPPFPITEAERLSIVNSRVTQKCANFHVRLFRQAYPESDQ